MLTCKEINEKASDYLDNELSFWQRIGFRIHLMLCTHCRRFMRQMELVVSSLKCFSRKPSISKQQADDIASSLVKHLPH